MGTVRFISDLHLGHKNILQFCPDRGGTDVQSHSEWIVHQWNSVVKKNDYVWVLGDIAFDGNHLHYLDQLRGQKVMLWGNHDKFTLPTYQKYFHLVYGFRKKYGYWLSHAPVHPQELRGKPNIHGHLHQHLVMGSAGEHPKLPDPRYVNVAVDQCDGKPISLDDINLRFGRKK